MSAISAYNSAAPGAPFRTLTPGMKRPPKPSPTTHTASAHAMDTGRARDAVRPQSRPAPIASCNDANAAFQITGWAVSRSVVRYRTADTGPGRPMLAMPSMLPKNALLNMYGCHCRTPSASHARAQRHLQPPAGHHPRRATPEPGRGSGGAGLSLIHRLSHQETVMFTFMPWAL